MVASLPLLLCCCSETALDHGPLKRAVARQRLQRSCEITCIIGWTGHTSYSWPELASRHCKSRRCVGEGESIFVSSCPHRTQIQVVSSKTDRIDVLQYENRMMYLKIRCWTSELHYAILYDHRVSHHFSISSC